MQVIVFLEWKFKCIIHPVHIKGTKNPADSLSRSSLSDLCLNKPFLVNPHDRKKANIPVQKPLKVMRYLLQAISGNFDYKSFFQKHETEISYDRRNRFVDPKVFFFQIGSNASFMLSQTPPPPPISQQFPILLLNN